VAYQIFDAKVLQLLEGRYKTRKPIQADSLEKLVRQLPIDHEETLQGLRDYHGGIGAGSFDPSIRDGLGSKGLNPPKSNWAQPLDTAPFVAYPVTGGITFTFGGVKIDGKARVLSTTWQPIPGLFACGELVGGLFHTNYPGGSGLMSGAVFGRIAGAHAAGE
jgi:tricarballylate dehydrogenase